MRKPILTFLTLLFGMTHIVGQNPDLPSSIQRGSELYADFCVTCHLPNGEGVPFAFPPLAKSDYLIKNRAASIKGIKYGNEGELIVNGITYNSAMAPMGLDDEEIADVMNFILNSWGNSSNDPVTIEEVRAITE
ncbi:c-type cytochrome [Maribacter polysiphoniae]|uniref:c-type cytochrome n=1 Tax=Maribacter polysiphoniae TaxID=429344 RepID=UPI00235506F4|nr:cytochrome c [Maribacter polysiphoniae]